jgi:hypothetical protein
MAILKRAGVAVARKAKLAVFRITEGRFAVGCYVSGGGRRWRPRDVFDDEGQARKVLAARIAEKK